jgi:hypothetical protein
VAGSPALSCSRHNQAKSCGCQAVCWQSWQICQRWTPGECWPRLGTGYWCCESQWWALSHHIYGCHKVASFSSPRIDSTDSASSSPQPEPKPQERRVSGVTWETLQPCNKDKCLDFNGSNNNWLRSLCARNFRAVIFGISKPRLGQRLVFK